MKSDLTNRARWSTSGQAEKELYEAENGNKMEGGKAVVNDYGWWAAGAGAAQLGWGVSLWRRGYAGPSGSMPLKAFAVGSLFVGAFASAGLASMRLSGIRTVEDLRVLGANIRARLGLHPRATDERST